MSDVKWYSLDGPYVGREFDEVMAEWRDTPLYQGKVAGRSINFCPRNSARILDTIHELLRQRNAVCAERDAALALRAEAEEARRLLSEVRATMAPPPHHAKSLAARVYAFLAKGIQ